MSRRGKRGAFLVAVAALVSWGCGSSAVDGGGRGTGIAGVTVQGNIAPTGPQPTGSATCDAIGAPAVVSVRGSDVSTQVGADCRFELHEVPAGDVTLDISAGDASTSVSINGVPPA